MSKRAEEAARKAIPQSGCNYPDAEIDRSIFAEGYEQAEKDKLTIADLERLHTFLYAVAHNKQGVFTFTRLSDEQYQEVLRRYYKAKEERKCTEA